MSVQIIRGNALALPLADASVDLVVTSPPYFGLRSYQDGGEHYAGQIGDEPTPAEFVDALIAATAEMVRVLKPSGSIWVNLGDKYAGSGVMSPNLPPNAGPKDAARLFAPKAVRSGVPTKSLIGIPERYRIRCIDELGLILRAVVIWSKPNGLPESVTDRVRRSHEDWMHFTKEPRYFSAVDEIREEYAPGYAAQLAKGQGRKATLGHPSSHSSHNGGFTDVPDDWTGNPLGKLPGSVWTIPTEPLHVPESLGIDHFAAFPTEWPRRIVQGWSPSGICTACGEGRRPVSVREPDNTGYVNGPGGKRLLDPTSKGDVHRGSLASVARHLTTITGESCACPEPTAPTRPAVVLDPFGGTGTTALVAHALGRHGISNDMSADYCRLAGWRTSDPKQLAKAARREYKPPAEKIDGQLDLLEGIA